MNILYRNLIVLITFISLTVSPGWGANGALLYVVHTDSGKVGIYDASKRIKIGSFPVGKAPLDIALSPDGKWFAVSHGGAEPDVLWIIDRESREVVRKINIYLTRYRRRGESYLVFSRDGKKLYAVDSATGFLNVIDTSKGQLVKKVALGIHPQNPQLSADGKSLYVPCLYSRDIKVVDTEQDAVVDSMNVDGMPSALAFSKNGKTMYVSDMESHRVLFIDIVTRSVIKEVSVGSAPSNIVLVDDISLYVLNTQSNNLSIIDTITKKNVKTLGAGILPRKMAFDPEGKRLYVLTANSSIRVYDTRSQTYIRSIAADVTPSGIVFVPAREESDISVSGTPYYFILDFDELKKSSIVQTEDDLKALKEIMRRYQESNTGKPALTWLGIPIWQGSETSWIMQDIIVELNPDLIIKTGTFNGGTALFYADVLKNINENGRVITVDKRPRVEEASKFKTFKERVEVIEGSSVSPDVIKKISKRIKDHHKVLVTLDSLHTKEHVLKELRLYSKFVSLNSYIAVQGTWLYTEDPDDGPLGAVKEFLKTNKNFVKDYSRGIPFSTAYPYGILKRIK